MIITEVDLIISTPENFGEPSELPRFYNVNFYNDGVPEFIIECYQGQSSGLGTWAGSRIMSNHNQARFAGILTADSVFLKTVIDTTLTVADEVVVSNHYTESCIQLDDEFVLNQVIENKFELDPKDELDNLFIDDTFKSDTVTLRRTQTQWVFLNGGDFGPDTLQAIANFNLRNCYEFPYNEPKYIGIILETYNEGLKLGWIKIQQLSVSAIHILECAIQE